MKLDKDKLFFSKKKKVIYSKLLDLLFVFIFSLTLYFSLAKPILNLTSYPLDKKSKEEYSSLVIKVGEESHLFRYYEDEKAISTVDGLYRIYITMHIKLCYESYSEYQTELDSYGYKDKLDIFKNYEKISYENGFLEEFYLDYIIDKKDINNNKIVSYDETNKYEYYVLNVLKVEEEGKEFFNYNESNFKEIPHLNLDTCRYLFQYNFMGVSYSTLREVDNAFFSYFLTLYNEAGDLLLKEKEYSEALNMYNEYYSKVNSYDIYSLLLTFLTSYLIYFILIPLLNSNKQTLSERILNIVKLNLYKEFKITTFLYYLIIEFIYSFICAYFLSLIVGGVNLVNYKFIIIGLFTINLSHITLLFLILDAIFIIKFFVSNNKIDKKRKRIVYYEVF